MRWRFWRVLGISRRGPPARGAREPRSSAISLRESDLRTHARALEMLVSGCFDRRGAVRTFTACDSILHSGKVRATHMLTLSGVAGCRDYALSLSLSLSLSLLSLGLCSSKHWSASGEARRRCAARVALRCDSMVLLAGSTVLDGDDGPVKVQAHGGSLATHRAQHDLGDHLRIDEGWSRDSCTPTRAMHRSAGVQVERPRVTTQWCAAAPDDWVAG